MEKVVPDTATDALGALERRLGHRFGDRRRLEQALTHRSASADNNERLEFLGDAILTATVSALLCERFAASNEGDLTRVRAHLVREESLHRVALSLGLPDRLRVSEGEARGGGQQRASMLADATEAIVGAVYLDGGYEAAQALVARLFGEQIANAQADAWHKDAKTELQEWLQARKRPVPAYCIVGTQGQAHAQTFEVECLVHHAATPKGGAGQGEGHRTRATGRSRRAAEQAAAEAMLLELQSNSAERSTSSAVPKANA